MRISAGAAAFAAWARENPTEFYRIASRLIPTEITAPDGGGVTVIVNRFPERGALPPDMPALPAPAVEH